MKGNKNSPLWDEKLKNRLTDVDCLFACGKITAEQGFVLRLVAIWEFHKLTYDRVYSDVVVGQKALKDYFEW